MINVIDMQMSFALKWAMDLKTPTQEKWKVIPQHILSELGADLLCFSSTVSASKYTGLTFIKSTFWSFVLTTWLDKNTQIIEQPSVPLSEQVLWNNSRIMFRGKSLFFKDWIDKRILFVKDIMVRSDMLPFQEVIQKVGNKPTRLFEYNALHTALRARAFQPAENIPGNVPTEMNTMTPKIIRLKLSHSSTIVPCAVNFWRHKYGITLNKSHWTMASSCTKEVRLRLLQWKILHNIYPTNILLSKMKVRDSNRCEFCNEIDYIEHFFWKCTKIQTVWTVCSEFIYKITELNVQLSDTTVLFGYEPQKQRDVNVQNINHLLLIAKMVISKFKYGTRSDLRALFENEVSLRKLMPL